MAIRAKAYLKFFPKRLEKKFWKFVEKRKPYECWPYRGYKWDGYGMYRALSDVDGKSHTFRAHRLAYALTRGEPDLDMVIMHQCNRRDCCNPSHLIEVVHRDNNEHMAACGRSLRGERNPCSVFRAEQVLEIRKQIATGEDLRDIAARWGVSRTAIYLIRERKTWNHLP